MGFSASSMTVAWIMLLLQNRPLIQALSGLVRVDMNLHLTRIAQFGNAFIRDNERRALLSRATQAHAESGVYANHQEEVRYILNSLFAVIATNFANESYTTLNLHLLANSIRDAGCEVGLTTNENPSSCKLTTQFQGLARHNLLTGNEGINLLIAWLENPYTSTMLGYDWNSDDVVTILRTVGIGAFKPELFNRPLNEMLYQITA